MNRTISISELSVLIVLLSYCALVSVPKEYFYYTFLFAYGTIALFSFGIILRCSQRIRKKEFVHFVIPNLGCFLLLLLSTLGNDKTSYGLAALFVYGAGTIFCAGFFLMAQRKSRLRDEFLENIIVALFCLLLLQVVIKYFGFVWSIDKGGRLGIAVFGLSLLFLVHTRGTLQWYRFLIFGSAFVFLSMSLKVMLFFLGLLIWIFFETVFGKKFFMCRKITYAAALQLLYILIPLSAGVVAILHDYNTFDQFVVSRFYALITQLLNLDSFYGVGTHATSDVIANYELRLSLFDIPFSAIHGEGLESERSIIGTSFHSAFFSVYFGGGLVALILFIWPFLYSFSQLKLKLSCFFQKNRSIWLLFLLFLIGFLVPIYSNILIFLSVVITFSKICETK